MWKEGRKMSTILLCSIVLGFINIDASVAAKPHIFLVLVDDLGWGNLGYRANEHAAMDLEINNDEHGLVNASEHVGPAIPEEAITPNIDDLVRAGIRLDRHYVYNYCSPSRASLQTGRLPVHVSVYNTEPIARNPNDPVSGYAGIPTKMTGIAAKLRSVGYRTHMTGKWDAGMATYHHTPMGKGYETFFGYYHHANDYYMQNMNFKATVTLDICYRNGMNLVDLWNTTGPAREVNGTAYEEELFTINTLNVLRNHDPKEPLFLFHSFHIVHTPLQIPRTREERFSYLKNEDRRKYAAMVNFMDEQLGIFVSEFQRKGMWENTLMILSSDNGGPIYAKGETIIGKTHDRLAGAASNIPLRGGKLSDWEGGIRVNAFVSGGYLPVERRGTVLNEYIHICDWYATIAFLAGVDAHDAQAEEAKLPPIDSINMWPLLSGKVEKSPRHEIHISEKTLILGDYKLLTGGLEQVIPAWLNRGVDLVPFDGYWPGYGWQADVRTILSFRNCKKGCLFNINEDPYETKDIAKENPDMVEKLKQRLDELNKSNFNPDRGTEDKTACEVAMNKYHGFYGPFVFDV